MIEPTKDAHRRRTSVYTIEFPGSSDDLDKVVAAAREITAVAGSGLYGARQAYLRVRVTDDAMATYVASEALRRSGLNIFWSEMLIHTGLGPSRRILQT